MSLSLFFISFSAIYLQIAMVRFFSNAYYGNISYFIISTALLGFGASGTFLAIGRKRKTLKPLNPALTASLTLLFTAAVLLLSPLIPLNLLYLLYDYRQILLLLLYAITLFIPFFFCGLFIGDYLIRSENRTRDYGINLLGSGSGGLAILILMYIFHPQHLSILVMAPLSLALMSASKELKTDKRILISLGAVVITVFTLIFGTIRSSPDQYKDLYNFHLLREQDLAEEIGSANSPYGRYEIWYSPVSHNTLFAGLNNPHRPPQQMTLFCDGDIIGSAFLSTSSAETAILDYTIQSLPYRLYDRPSVLLLGDAGLIHLLLALRFDGDPITVLLPDKSLEELLMDNLPELRKEIEKKGIRIISGDYRSFFHSHPGKFDIIHFAGAESLRGSQSGLYSFREDYVLTVESFSQAARLLSPGGVLSLSRGKQLPSRDNIKIDLMMNEIAGKGEVRQFENYLALISLLFISPPERETMEKLENAAADLNLKTREGKISEESALFDLRPAEDNRPFFHSFFQWRSLKSFTRMFGSYWFRESQGSHIILAVTLIFLCTASFLLILLPHLRNRKLQKPLFLLYFPLIGISFMAIEMVLIQKTALFLGHSSFSLSVVLSAVLIASGLGSLFMGRVKKKRHFFLFAAFAAISTLTFTAILFSNQILQISSILSLWRKPALWAFFLFYCGTTGFFMGFFFAPGLDILEKIDKRTLPLAWAINGFASVTASPITVLLSLSFGFSAPLAMASLFYLSAALLFSCYYLRAVV